jgi:hypothetical protein
LQTFPLTSTKRELALAKRVAKDKNKNRGLSNYLFGGKQISLRAALDWFIAKITNSFLRRKYPESYRNAFLNQRVLNGELSPLYVKEGPATFASLACE